MATVVLKILCQQRLFTITKQNVRRLFHQMNARRQATHAHNLPVRFTTHVKVFIFLFSGLLITILCQQFTNGARHMHF